MNFKSETMNLHFSGKVGYLTFKKLEKYPAISHAFSTRYGGVSKNEFSSMNFYLGDSESAENVEENYKIFCDALGYDKKNLVRSRQIHGNKIKLISKEDITNGNLNFQGIDGFITDIPGIVLKTSHADCCPVYIFDPIRKVVGLAHAGWRGTVSGIAENLAFNFTEKFGSKKDNLICALGPCIGKCCFEVGEDVKHEFDALNFDIAFKKCKNNKFKIDIKEINKKIMENFGIPSNNIIKSDICSCCNKDLLFSNRATKGKRGNNAAFIMIKN